MINGVRKIVIPVDDEDRAKEFWTAAVGFQATRDETYGQGQRWLEVTPPDGSLVLVLSRRLPGDIKPQVPDELPHSLTQALDAMAAGIPHAIAVLNISAA